VGNAEKQGRGRGNGTAQSTCVGEIRGGRVAIAVCIEDQGGKGNDQQNKTGGGKRITGSGLNPVPLEVKLSHPGPRLWLAKKRVRIEASSLRKIG